MRAVRVLDGVGFAVVLQLCFVLCAAPVLTAFPAAVALQRQWDRHRRGHIVGARSYLREFAGALRESWWAGVAFAAIVISFLMALLFWRNAPEPIGPAAVALLIGLGMVATTAYLAVLAESIRTHTNAREWFRSAGALLLLRLPAFGLGAGAVAVMWIVVAMFPPMVVAVTGIVPALLASWAAPPDQASRS